MLVAMVWILPWGPEDRRARRCQGARRHAVICSRQSKVHSGIRKPPSKVLDDVGWCWMMLDDVFLCILPTSTDIYRPHRYKSLEWIECWRQEPSRTIFITCYYLLNPWTWAVSNRRLLKDVEERCRKTSMKMELCSGMWVQAALEESIYSSSTCTFFFRSFAGRPWFPLHCSAYTGVLTPEKWWKMHVCASLLLRSRKSLRQWQSKHLETCWNMLKHVEPCWLQVSQSWTCKEFFGQDPSCTQTQKRNKTFKRTMDTRWGSTCEQDNSNQDTREPL